MLKWSNAVRILKLRDLMHDYSDEGNPLMIKEIAELVRRQLPADYVMPSISTLETDLEQLTASGFAIHRTTSAHNTFLYHHKKTFSPPEIRMLLDAIASARFISSQDTEELSSKIRRLGGHYLGHEMNSMIKTGDRLKQNGDGLHRAIQALHQSIADRKTVEFTYGKYTYGRRLEFQLNRGGESYRLDPYELYWNSDYYYLIGKSEGRWRHFRVDRIVEVRVTEQSFQRDATFELSTYIKGLFKMYVGEMQFVEIRFHHHLINVVVDHFGTDLDITPDGEHFVLRFQGAVSEGLVRWILTWGSDAEVLYPPHLRTKLREEAAKMLRHYKVEEVPQ